MEERTKEIRASTQRIFVWIGALLFCSFTTSVGFRVWLHEAATGIASVRHGVTLYRTSEPSIFASAHGGTGFETAIALIFALGFLAATVFEIGHRHRLRACV